jgi:hypothetical protein
VPAVAGGEMIRRRRVGGCGMRATEYYNALNIAWERSARRRADLSLYFIGGEEFASFEG